MKTLLTTVVVLIINTVIYAQPIYLKVTKSNHQLDYIMYPPGTAFKLLDNKGQTILTEASAPTKFVIKDNNYKLIVSPNYKNENDIYNLSEGKVEILATKDYGQSNSTSHIRKGLKNEITAKKELTESTQMRGQKNLKFELSNGITFKYIDGKYSAMLEDEDLIIKGKYLIYSDIGVLKLSFNPSNGVLWWVFEKAK